MYVQEAAAVEAGRRGRAVVVNVSNEDSRGTGTGQYKRAGSHLQLAVVARLQFSGTT